MSGTTGSRRLALAAPVLAMTILLSSCAAGGAESQVHNFVPVSQVDNDTLVSQVEDVDLGMTEREVIELMGKPGLVRQNSFGEMWTWTSVEADEWGFLKSKSVSVQIRNGRVFAWHRSPKD